MERTQEDRTSGYRVPALEQAIRILRYLGGRTHRPWGVSELSRALQVNKSTCFAILKTLEQHGLVVADRATKKYALGTALIELGGAAASQVGGAVVAKPFLQELSRDLRLTCLLGRRVQDRVIVIDRVEAEADFRVTVPIGQAFPLVEGALGKSLLAHVRETELERILRATQEGPKGGRGMDVAVLRRELLVIRRRGVAISFGEVQAGIHSVAAPIFDAHGEPALAVGVVGLASSLPPKVLAPCGRRVREEAVLITRALGGRSHR